jgi:hypothetical protein
MSTHKNRSVEILFDGTGALAACASGAAALSDAGFLVRDDPRPFRGDA